MSKQRDPVGREVTVGVDGDGNRRLVAAARNGDGDGDFGGSNGGDDFESVPPLSIGGVA